VVPTPRNATCRPLPSSGGHKPPLHAQGNSRAAASHCAQRWEERVAGGNSSSRLRTRPAEVFQARQIRPHCRLRHEFPRRAIVATLSHRAICRILARVEIASETAIGTPCHHPATLFVTISQSLETADTWRRCVNAKQAQSFVDAHHLQTAAERGDVASSEFGAADARWSGDRVLRQGPSPRN